MTEMVAIIARVVRALPSGYEFETVVPREDFPPVKICTKHPRLVYFDGPGCPACKAEKEFIALTSERS